MDQPAQDFSESASATFNLAEQKSALLSAIVESSEDAIISKTLQGLITSWNPAAKKLFGYNEAEAIGSHISLIIPKERLDEETYIIGEIRKGNKVDHFQTLRLTKNGSLIPISLSVSPILDNKGNVIGASKIARDITTQQADQAEKARLYEQVRALNDKKDEFISLASHELKTPLTSINAYLQILSQVIKEERPQQMLSKAQLQVKKLTALIADLLDISRIEAGKLNFSFVSFPVSNVVKEAIELITSANADYHISLHTSVTDLCIIGDPHRIEQVIINLLTNAVRYAPGSNIIHVYLEQDMESVKVGIRDFGIGIPADKLTDIFSRFYRVDENSTNVAGLGIGLYLSHQIVTRHNGKIWVESEAGKGSIFWFTLPLTGTYLLP